MTASRPVLVVADKQNGFVREQSAHIVPIVVELVRAWQEAAGDILFTRYFNYPGSPFEWFLGWRKLESTPETDIIAELTPYIERGFVLDKDIYSPFAVDGIKLAQEQQWAEVYFCGIATESCVLKGVVDAFERNYTPWLIADASASHAGQTAHEAGLLVAIRFIGPGQVISRNDIPANLLKGCADD